MLAQSPSQPTYQGTTVLPNVHVLRDGSAAAGCRSDWSWRWNDVATPPPYPKPRIKGSEPAAPPAAQLEDQKRTELRKGVLSDKRM
jgi:hypothetical protein